MSVTAIATRRPEMLVGGPCAGRWIQTMRGVHMLMMTYADPAADYMAPVEIHEYERRRWVMRFPFEDRGHVHAFWVWQGER